MEIKEVDGYLEKNFDFFPSAHVKERVTFGQGRLDLFFDLRFQIDDFRFTIFESAEPFPKYFCRSANRNSIL